MLIYVEGIDKAGKTTFIEKFSNLTKIKSYRKQPPISLVPNEYHPFFKGMGYSLLDMASLFDFSVIVDRSFISDWVYSQRDKFNYHINEWIEWEHHHKKDDTTTVLYFHVSKKIFNERISKNPDIFMSVDEYDLFCESYKEYFLNTNFEVVQISGEENFNNQIKKLYDETKNNELKYHLLTLLGNN